MTSNKTTTTNDYKYTRIENTLVKALRSYYLSEDEINDFISIALHARTYLNDTNIEISPLSFKDRLNIAKRVCPYIKQIINSENEDGFLDNIDPDELKEVLKKENYINKIIELLNHFNVYSLKKFIENDIDNFKNLLMTTEDLYDTVFF